MTFFALFGFVATLIIAGVIMYGSLSIAFLSFVLSGRIKGIDLWVPVIGIVISGALFIFTLTHPPFHVAFTWG